MVAAVCPRCSGVVALHEGKPFISASGTIELWHRSCWDTRHARGVEEVTVVAPPPSRKPHVLVGVGAGVALAGVAFASYALRVELPTASLATINFEPREALAPHSWSTERETSPPMPTLEELHPVPIAHGIPLDEMYPSLLDWIHPVANAEHTLAQQSTGRFGATREHVDRDECGRGHCGIDLDGPIGRPIVAVADGVIVRVERSELGRDGRSGRYVRIEHPDGALTSYMHLDEIVEGLGVGDRVDGGQQIGTLGATGIVSAAPHLHFSLEVPNVPGTHGDHANTQYVDPAPFLVRAGVSKAPDRRRADKPVW